MHTGCILDFEVFCRLTDFYLNINRIIQLDRKVPQNLKYNLYIQRVTDYKTKFLVNLS